MSSTTTGQQKNDRDYAWHRHPALLAGIPAVAAIGGAVLTVVLGQAGALPQAINPAPPTTTVTSTVLGTTTVTASATSTDSPSSDPVAGGAGTLVWKEKVNIPVGDGIDIDQPGPVVNLDWGAIEVYGFDLTGGVPYARTWGRAAAGGLDPATPATYDGCTTALATNAEHERFRAAKGTAFCVRSGLSENPHLALFQVQGVNTSTNKAELEVTVWSIS
ncbi:hypothetical protein EV649_1815 [Kribbella sp. VKM Ac-2569]|uniref:hypothetical protein n=1 Tax=Kribbella sp. VKM Ac-2569 TaxID=2512220 RepID=UPI00102ADD4C|nr:hypothetical protein [Kribbella sp. VKM Ac-2569]RZT28039.1 hypothetical protein EV649_1815 [Kribbella sp. VKM Ac-2569]